MPKMQRRARIPWSKSNLQSSPGRSTDGNQNHNRINTSANATISQDPVIPKDCVSRTTSCCLATTSGSDKVHVHGSRDPSRSSHCGEKGRSRRNSSSQVAETCRHDGGTQRGKCFSRQWESSNDRDPNHQKEGIAHSLHPHEPWWIRLD